MALSRRLRVVVPGGVAVVAMGLFMALAVALPVRDGSSRTVVLGFVCSVIFAPIVLLVPSLHRWMAPDTLVPTMMIVIAVIAILAIPLDPLLARRWSAAVTIVGLMLWLLCTVIVAGAPL